MIIYIFFLLGSFVSTKCLAQDVAWIEGCVYEDGNQNGIQDKGEKGISGIAISNGDTVLLADKQGHFRIRLSKGNSIFPILPNNWTLLSNQIVNSGFYYWNSHGDTETQQINFGLNKKKVNKHFSINAIGDVQVGNSQELDYASRSLWPELLQADSSSFNIFLGDLVNNNLNLGNYIQSYSLKPLKSYKFSN